MRILGLKSHKMRKPIAWHVRVSERRWVIVVFGFAKLRQATHPTFYSFPWSFVGTHVRREEGVRSAFARGRVRTSERRLFSRVGWGACRGAAMPHAPALDHCDEETQKGFVERVGLDVEIPPATQQVDSPDQPAVQMDRSLSHHVAF